MPVEKIQGNPRTGTGVYYPASVDRIFAFHGVCGYPPWEEQPKYAHELREIVATEEAFRTIWKQGVLLSSTVRREFEKSGERVHNSLIFATDAVAGDGQYVFLTVTEPHSIGSKGYHFAFDAYQLVEAGAVIGLDDLGSVFYGSAAEKIGVQNRNDLSTWTPEQIEEFRERIRPVQEVWRISGEKALDWLDWVHGKRASNPVSAKAIRTAANKVTGTGRWAKIGEHTVEHVTKDRRSSRKAELLVPRTLLLDMLVGVIFRKNWVEIQDFVEAYGLPGTEPPPALDPWQANKLGSYGHPARCKRCGDWIFYDPLSIKEGSSVFDPVWRSDMKVPGVEQPIMVIRCNSCDAAFGHRSGDFSSSYDPFLDEEYLGQFGDMKYAPRGW
jgi:hypothetical protein